MKTYAAVLLTLSLLTSACGGGSSGSTNPTPTEPNDDVFTVERLWRDAGFGLAAADEVVDNVYIAMDYVYDDKGANTNGLPGGDSSYPSGEPYFGNAADIVEIRLGHQPGSDSLWFGSRLNTVQNPTVAVVAIGIDDGSSPEIYNDWPFAAGVKAKGVRYVLTLRGTTATLTDLKTSQSQDFYAENYNDTGETARNLENTLSVEIPMAALGLKREQMPLEWRVYAVSGLWNGSQWSTPPFDVAFYEDDFTNWQQNKQADLLAGGDISEANAHVHFSEFPNRRSPVRTGQQARIYPSPISKIIGEGITEWKQGIQGLEIPTLNHYRGLYLPYSVWIPESLGEASTPQALFLFLHGASQNHLDMLNAFESGTVNVPAYTIAPLGAGELSFYKEEGEIDVLSAMQDFMTHYPIDADRVFLSGLSMGGQGTFSIATHWPELFAGAIPFIGTGQSTFNEDIPIDEVGNEKIPEQRWMNSTGRELLENAHNLPWRMQNGMLDPIVNPTWPAQDVMRMQELGNDYQWALFHTETHNVNASYQNALYHQVLNGCQSAEIPGCVLSRDPNGLRRDTNPARVIYKIIPFHFTERLGLRYEGAYWVSGMEVKETPSDGSFGLVDATSFALAHKLKTGRETLGPDPLVIFEPTLGSYQFQGVRHLNNEEQTSPRLEARLENLSAITFDMARAGLAQNESREVIINTDTETQVTFKNLKAGTAVYYPDKDPMLVNDSGFISFTVPASQGEMYRVELE